MPTYDYRCDACGYTFEEFQSFSDDVLTKCPECKKKKLQRLFGTGAGVIFKGSGFYETDYRSDSYKQAAKADTDKTATSGSDSKNASSSTNGATGAKGAQETAKAKPLGKRSKSES
jgi:putative FmdB family regulatory protein